MISLGIVVARLCPTAVWTNGDRRRERHSTANTAQTCCGLIGRRHAYARTSKESKPTSRLLHALVVWSWGGDDTVSTQTDSDDKAQTGCRSKSDEVNQPYQDGRGGWRQEGTKHLESRAAEEIRIQKKAGDHRECNPAEAGNYQHRALYVCSHAGRATAHGLMSAVRQGGPTAPKRPQDGEPALACTALVRNTNGHGFSRLRRYWSGMAKLTTVHPCSAS